MSEEYHDGEYEYGLAETLIEEIVDRFNLRAYVYLSNPAFDNVLTTTMLSENSDEEEYENTRYETLLNLVIDILNDKDGNERNAAIAEIYDIVHQAIHDDDEDDFFDEIDGELE